MKRFSKYIMLVIIFSLCLCGCSSSKESELAADKSGKKFSVKNTTEGKDEKAVSEVTGEEEPSKSTRIDMIPGESEIPVFKEDGMDYDLGEKAGDTEFDESKKVENKVEVIDKSFAETPMETPLPERIMVEGDSLFDSEELIITRTDETEVILPEVTRIPVQAGLLTAGEWNDNKNPDFIRNLLNNGQGALNYKQYFERWRLTPFNRITVCVTASGSVSGTAIKGASVALLDASGNSIYNSITDNQGMAYTFYNMTENDQIPVSIMVTDNENMVTYMLQGEDYNGSKTIGIDFSEGKSIQNEVLDLMFVFDTTGSMGDELTYLQEEMRDVIRRVKNDNGNIPINLSVNFYRDLEDDYTVKSYPFSTNIDEQIGYLNMEYASGGGDYEEAVEMALLDAVNNHSWTENNTKLMFLVLDAPPHNTDEICDKLASVILTAARQGIRIIPIASSGVDKDTEFLLRAMAMATGGTYTFLTDDSGIGESHMEPTVGAYEVEKLNEMLIRIISGYLKK